MKPYHQKHSLNDYCDDETISRIELLCQLKDIYSFIFGQFVFCCRKHILPAFLQHLLFIEKLLETKGKFETSCLAVEIKNVFI